MYRVTWLVIVPADPRPKAKVVGVTAPSLTVAEQVHDAMRLAGVKSTRLWGRRGELLKPAD